MPFISFYDLVTIFFGSIDFVYYCTSHSIGIGSEASVKALYRSKQLSFSGGMVLFH